MPRPLVFGNGIFHLCLDAGHRIRDLYFPQCGLPNHLSGHAIRWGFWCEENLSWVGDEGWEVRQRYDPGALCGLTQLESSELRIVVEVREAVHPTEPVFVRRLKILNRAEQEREVRLFQHNDLRIAGTEIGDTALFDPVSEALIHYKGAHWFLFGGRSSNGGLFEFATGIKDFGGFEGTWRDAEDGHLSGHPISQGSVDSTFSLAVRLGPNESADLELWIVAGTDLEDVRSRTASLNGASLLEVLAQARSASENLNLAALAQIHALPQEWRLATLQSLQVLRTHLDAGGAVIAANDSDIMKTARAHYSYCWPRDASLTVMALDALGWGDPSERWVRFLASVIQPDRPGLFQKYRPDGKWGASWHTWNETFPHGVPLQLDQTALALVSLCDRFERRAGDERESEIFQTLAKPLAELLYGFRSPKTGFPLPSYDLWEERLGVHAFTCATVFWALDRASAWALRLGDASSERWAAGASEIRSAVLQGMYDASGGCFLRRLDPDAKPDPTIDASALWLLLVGLVAPHHEFAHSTLQAIEERLWVRTEVGGLARYEDDYYFRVSHDLPGNPWVICTLWLARCHLLFDADDHLARAIDLVKWAQKVAAPTGVLPEQVHPYTGEPLSVSPLAWSHSEWISAALALNEKATFFEGAVETS